MSKQGNYLKTTAVIQFNAQISITGGGLCVLNPSLQKLGGTGQIVMRLEVFIQHHPANVMCALSLK